MQLIYTTIFLNGSAEIMLMNIITSSLKDQYKIINKYLHTSSIEVALNKTRAADKPKILTPNEMRETHWVMEQMMEKHFQLTIVAKTANKVFGVPILITLAEHFQTLTMTIYYILYTSTVDAAPKFLSVGVAVFWCIPLILHIWLIVRMWSTLANEVNIFYYHRMYILHILI